MRFNYSGYWNKFARDIPGKNRPIAIGEWIRTKYGYGKITDITVEVQDINYADVNHWPADIILSVVFPHLPHMQGIYKFQLSNCIYGGGSPIAPEDNA